eukprot:scaffold91200_cov27-Tisochrysis_lutea.AAC.3
MEQRGYIENDPPYKRLTQFYPKPKPGYIGLSSLHALAIKSLNALHAVRRGCWQTCTSSEAQQPARLEGRKGNKGRKARGVLLILKPEAS